MASKRRNMFHKNKTQETTEKGRLPWSTGLLKEMPGTGPRYIPYHFPETTYPSTSTAVCRPSPEQGRRKEAKKLKTVMDVCDQMMYFLKIIMLANELLEEEKKGGGGGEKPPEGAPPAQPAEAPPALPAQEAPPAPPTQEAPSAPPTQDAPPEAPVQEAPPQPPPEG
ncbi:hypothetical protein AAG570_003914 [Ranatra chinensis]|uniref:Uncharacterized protein n=1 Tax=Ranatra chinensis TaxID=642074 RepID=A0ABD0YP26_9HEMI